MCDNFKRFLTENSLTRYQVFKATGVSQGSLSDWLHEKSIPKYENLKKIADYYGVSVEYLRDEEKPAPKNGDELVADEFIAFYGETKKHLTKSDIDDLKALMRLRSELNRDNK